MPLLRLTDLDLAYGHHVLLDKASLQLYKGDRICLVGRNGAGKSTLMKIVEGNIKPDGGNIWTRPGVVIARLDQDLPAANEDTVYDVVASGLADLGKLLKQYDELSSRAADQQSLQQLEKLQHQLEAKDGWSYQQKIAEVLSRLALTAESKMKQLSGGWRRRVALAKALVVSPDLLLLDEPTNHLDIETIEWLQKQLLDFNGAVLFITHDRAFLRTLATKIVELDRGQFKAFNFGYDKYLEEREHLLAVEEQQNALFDKKLAQEEVWIRQGIKARRTRNEGRVRALKKLREERSQRREQQGTASIQVDAASISGKLVAEVKDLSYSYGDVQLIKPVSFNILRGDKVGLLGPNGVGKTTLLKLLLGELEPSAGEVKRGSRLEVAYFDQMRAKLDDDKTIVDIVGQGRDSITINGKPRHIMSYLSDFLFSAERARTPVKALSGGERNRVQLACLFSLPANLLVMDEPTNDLDVETLELLESVLVDFPGTVLLVSHDRDFMDNVVTSTLAFEGEGVVREYVGGYQNWVLQGGRFNHSQPVLAPSPKEPTCSKTANETANTEKNEQSSPRKKLSYKEQRELEQLPEKIETLEQKQGALQAETTAADFYQQDHEQVAAKLEELASITSELETCYNRWVELADE